MTENEIIREIRFNMSTKGLSEKAAKRVVDARNAAIKALEEIQQYRAIGTVEKVSKLKELYDKAKWLLDDERKTRRSYESIGTVEELQALKEKSVAKKPVPYYPWEGKCPSCNVIFTSNLTQYCGNCGQKLERSEG